MAFKPTPQQELAINTNGSLLVSAAAGSGKTAVLVERVIRLLTDDKNPVSADKLLVITFTNAAAAELKLRIEKKLNETMENSPYSPLLQKQKILMSNAKICTIDSFCLDFIRENYETSGLNPSFKIAEASVINNLTTLAINKVFEDYYNADDKEFLELLEFVGSDYDDSKLSDSVLNIFQFSRQMPFPREWINEIKVSYEKHAKGLSSQWQDNALNMVLDMLNEGSIYIQKACDIIECHQEAKSKYGDNYYYILDFFNSFKEIAQEKNWDKAFNKATEYAPVKCKALKSEYKTKDVEYSKDLKDKADGIAKSLKSLLYCDQASLQEEFAFCSTFVNKITEIVYRFEEEFYNLLKEKNLITFYIAEQTTLSMIAEYKNGKVVARSGAEDFINQYDAVFVDEYQDTNDMQDCLFSILSDNEKKLFLVGDAKQSIYKFRGANPYNFITKREKYRNYAKDNNEKGKEIELGCNFRSRKEICYFVNSFFEKLMTKENADIDYKNGESLEPKADFLPTLEPKVETYLLDCKKINDNGFMDEEDEKIFKAKAEANAIADIIEETVKKEPFLKAEEGLRKAEYKDITILLRSVANYGEILVEVLKNRGIPVSISAGDLLNTHEAVLLISLLKIINNPYDDIALLNVLTSPLFAFSMEELAKMRILNKKGKFIGAVSSLAKNETKTKEFLKTLSHLRRKSIVLGLSKLIEEIFETTGILSIMSELENGSSRVDNLLSIQDYALRFEEDRKKSLSEFLNALENLKGKDFKSSPGNLSNCVTVMSIHGSKGLQFPICILSNMAKNFNFTDLNDHMLIDEKYGFSFNYFDKEKREKSKTLLRLVMSDFAKAQLRAEELRLLYVAMTRAEEKLIMTASYSDLQRSIVSRLSSLYDSDKMENIDYSVFKKTMSYGDWLLLSELTSPRGDALKAYVGLLKANNEEANSLNKINIIENLSGNILSHTQQDFAINKEDVDSLKEIYNFKYPFEALLGLESKASVTDIVHKADEKTYQFKTRPAFLSKDGLSGAERGTATHKFMQYCNYENAVKNLAEEKERLYEIGFLTENEAEAVDINSINEFFASELFRRITASDLVKREMRFLTEFSATDLKSDLDKSFKSEKIVVQGAVDLLFVEDGKLVIVDFKTDRNKNEEELKTAYKEQLEIYAKACSKLLSFPVGEMIIYSFSLNKSIKL